MCNAMRRVPVLAVECFNSSLGGRELDIFTHVQARISR